VVAEVAVVVIVVEVVGVRGLGAGGGGCMQQRRLADRGVYYGLGRHGWHVTGIGARDGAVNCSVHARGRELTRRQHRANQGIV
jgi:hypothetical protein